MENKKIQDKVTVLKAITSGDLQTKLSIPFMGLGIFLKGQKIKRLPHIPSRSSVLLIYGYFWYSCFNIATVTW